MEVTVGSAPDSWGIWFPDDPKQTPWNRFLDEIAEAGYKWTELGPYGYLPTDPAALRRELESRDLQVAGNFVMTDLEVDYPEVEKEVISTAELLVSLNAGFLVLIPSTYTNLFTGEQLRPPRLDSDGWSRLLDNIHRLAEMLRQRFGLQLVFHHHADTHVEYPEQVEALLDETDPSVGMCLDTGHYSYRGGDSADLMRRRHDRIPYLHVKSVDPAMKARVEEENTPFATAVAMDMFCEPSKGAVDFLEFRDVLQEINYRGFAIVEQDMYPAPFDKPLPIAQSTRRYLREIGLG